MESGQAEQTPDKSGNDNLKCVTPNLIKKKESKKLNAHEKNLPDSEPVFHFAAMQGRQSKRESEQISMSCPLFRVHLSAAPPILRDYPTT